MNTILSSESSNDKNKSKTITDTSITLNKIDFPYRNKIYTDKDRIDRFNKLKNKKLYHYTTDYFKDFYPNIVIPRWNYLFEGKYQFILYDPRDYDVLMLSDLFNDECRAHCQFGSHVSPYMFYQKNKDKLIKKLKERGIKLTPINMREIIHKYHKECSIHNPLIIKYFIEKYNAKHILDPSSGWGDRLIGFMLSNAKSYVGIDINSCLHPNYQKIISLLSPLTSEKQYKLLKQPFQHTKFSDKELFDLVYTSPPYFDYEIYTAKNDVEKDEDKWINDFLFPSMEICIKHTIMEGHIVMYFSQQRGKKYIEKWLKFMKEKKEIYYLGNIFYADVFLKGIHPIFIFQKSDTIPKNLYNPPLVTTKIRRKNMTLNVIRDDLLIGGTKLRAMPEYLSHIITTNANVTEFCYLGASNGYAQVALSYTLYLLKSNLKLLIYFQKVNLSEANKLVTLSSGIYDNIKYVKLSKSFKNIYPIIDNYLEESPGTLLIPFGCDDPIFKEILKKKLAEHITDYVDRIKRLWIVLGSGTLFRILYQLLPKTHFCTVRVGKKADLTGIDEKRISIYVSSFKLYERFPVKILYPTTKSYDGKIWEFEDKFQDGDYIWNVAGIHKKL